jgi:hypothetical protein
MTESLEALGGASEIGLARGSHRPVTRPVLLRLHLEVAELADPPPAAWVRSKSCGIRCPTGPLHVDGAQRAIRRLRAPCNGRQRIKVKTSPPAARSDSRAPTRGVSSSGAERSRWRRTPPPRVAAGRWRGAIGSWPRRSRGTVASRRPEAPAAGCAPKESPPFLAVGAPLTMQVRLCRDGQRASLRVSGGSL